MRILRAAVFAALFLLALPVASDAGDITLTSRDGSIELTGDLVGYDGEYYRIATEYGVLTVDGSGVTCDGPGCPNLGAFVAQLTFSGAPELSRALIPALIEDFAKRQGFVVDARAQGGEAQEIVLREAGGNGNKAAEITIFQKISDQGFADLLDEAADFALSVREASAVEKRRARDLGLGDLGSFRQARVLALDALVAVVAPDNPVRKITMAQLAEIFTGKITNWAELGGEDAPITPYLPIPGSGFSSLIDDRVLVGVKPADSVRFQSTNHALVQAVARDPFGIGMAVLSDTGATDIVTLTGACGFEVAASQKAVKAEDYPLTAPLYIYRPARRLPKIGREFLRYLRSDAAQSVVRQVGLVDQVPQETTIDQQGRRLANAILAAGEEVTLERLQDMAGLMAEFSRLTLTFRFRIGSSEMDAQSQSNVALLAALLETGRFDGRTLRFVGFSDGQGGAEANQVLAAKRARRVMQAVREAAETLAEGRVDMDATAFGEALPMACDDSEWGRQVNRRVEVWLR